MGECARQRAGAVALFSVPQPRQVACTGKPTRYSCPRAKRRCMRPSRQTPSSLSQRVQRHSEFEVVGLVFAAPDQLVWAAWRGGKGVGMEVLLYVEPFQ
ncbi:MAG: hypothetical protein VR71_15220 [Roseovarius sp. BRH_c41]|nr:MAG: hypothetical protein VR71_15220 [Roseovarius sp. BRH_c41]